MQLEQRLAQLGLQLPPPPPAAGNYVAGVISGNLLFAAWMCPSVGAAGSVPNSPSRKATRRRGKPR